MTLQIDWFMDQIRSKHIGDTDMVHAAFLMAQYAHKDQKRDHTGVPYFYHCLDVAQVLSMTTANLHLIAAGLLHDTLEDTALTADVIEITCGRDVLRLVREVTNPCNSAKTHPHMTRTERRAANTAHLCKASEEGKTLKLADIMANCRDVRMHGDFGKTYIAEKREFLKKCPGGDPKLRSYVEHFILGELI